mmetsp:Transcript_46617/g.101311  ORF Transcript_46617/g.101311 Transcript_46617/m.101311 type:complete len:373 (-) Transcript_46617:2316-3434(-)
MVTSAVAGSYPSACGRPSHLEHHLGGGDVVAVERGEDDVVQRVERAASNRTACLLFDEFGEAFGQVGLVLGRHGGQRRRVDGGVLAVGGDERQFGHQQAVCRLEKVEQACERHLRGVGHEQLVPKRVALGVCHLIDVHVHLGVPALAGLDLGAGRRLGEQDARAGERQVGKGVATRLERQRVQLLVELEQHEAGRHRRRRRDGRDDATRLDLCLELVDLLDGVVASTQVAEARDEVHVEVRVVVLFKLVGLWREARRDLRVQELVDGGLDVGGVLLGRGARRRPPPRVLLLVVRLDRHVVRRREGARPARGRRLEHRANERRVSARRRRRHAQHEGAQVRRRNDKLHVQRVFRVKVDSLGQPLRRRPEGHAL